MTEKTEKQITDIEELVGYRNPSLTLIFYALKKKGFLELAVQTSGHLMWYGKVDFGEAINWNEIWWGDQRIRWILHSESLHIQSEKTIDALHWYLFRKQDAMFAPTSPRKEE